MGRLIDIMMGRLEKKGLAPDEIHRFIRDVTNSISPDHDSGLEGVNTRLHLLGWETVELDDQTFQLIMANFEARGVWGETASR